VLVGVAFVFVAGLLVFLALGLTALPGDFLRRVAQTGAGGRSERGGALPEEVPTASAEEAAQAPDED
jgi:hypothetical protein